MCNIWKFPTNIEDEFKPSLLEKIPKLSFCNITGGEPFLRDDLEEIVKIVKRKARRIVISTNGYLVNKILDLAKKNRDIGIRVSLEGLPEVNDELRGVKGSFEHGLRSILGLKELGLKDIGFAITVSDRNIKDLEELYRFSKAMRLEFATAVVHNSYYFHKYDNKLHKQGEAVKGFQNVVKDLLESKRIKNWFRAYFNHGLINYIQQEPRLLPCTAATLTFFLDPRGEVMPCNGLEEGLWLESVGNLHEQSFEELWFSAKARKIRDKVRRCPKNCWMIGTVAPAMKKNILKIASWVVRKRLLLMFKVLN